ncbi:MAG: 50S ribosomal protein L25 [Patescibacteria group bacterium]
MLELQTKNRTVFGKKVKNIRAHGLIPAELFGANIKNLHLSVPLKEFAKVYKSAGENTIVNVVTEEGKKIPVFISAVIKNHLSNQLLAVDFHSVQMDEKIKLKVPIEFIGVAPALKSGFVVVKVTTEIEVEALPNEVPHNFEVDLTSLENVGQGIRVADLKVAKAVKIITSGELVIANVAEKAKEEVAAPTVAPITEITTAKVETEETEAKSANGENKKA